MKSQATRFDAFELFMEGTQALADVEENGMRISVEYFEGELAEADLEIRELKEQLRDSEEGRIWADIYRGKTNYDSDDQLRVILFDELELESLVETKGEKRSVSVKALEHLADDPFVQLILSIRKLEKLHGTYLTGILREQVDGYLYPFFNLHNVLSYRSSSSLPNLQNVPVRDPMITPRVRGGFIPSDGNVLLEVDYGALEVRISAPYHEDPTMIQYIEEDYDFHKELAAQCYDLEPDNVTKNVRYCGKNKFVFPQFYGSYFKQCAPDLWAAVEQLKLETADGVPLRKHLKKQGYTTYKKFERLIQNVEEDFWGNRFAVYAQWKDEWFDAYLAKGCFDTLTGFRCSGEMSRNQVINFPVQGSAFHCLLWSLVNINGEMKRLDMESKIVNQVHDSIIFDAHPAEVSAICDLCLRIMVKEIRENWEWINVPLAIEAEVTPINGAWNEKQEIQLDAA